MTRPNDERTHRGAPAVEPGPGQPLLALLQAHQRRGWRRGERPLVETYLVQHPAIQADAETVLDLIYTEILSREEAGESPRLEEYVRRFPRLEPRLRRQFEVEQALGSGVSTLVGGGLSWTGRGELATGLSVPVSIPGYEILGELGRGGMGVVYKARHARLNRTVALKMILAGEHAGPEVSVRFLAEAEAVARLLHPNIIQIFAFGAHDGRPYFEMEYAAGGSLADRLDGTPRPARDAARLVETLARAVHEVHRVGIVHRDLKPANVLLTADDTPKVADFGLAKVLEAEARLTHTLRIVGSPSYMAPEQAGAGSGPIGPAADVYALGAILYELLTGRPPFRAATVLETLDQVKSAEPVQPRRLRPDLARDLATICLTCLQKEPARRYAGADLLAEDLRRFGAGEAIRARPVGPVGRAWRWCRREPALAALAAALVAGLVVAATQWWRAERHLGEEKRQAALLQGHLGEEKRQAALLQGHLGEEKRQAALLQESFLREFNARRASDDARAREQEARRRAQARFQLGLEAVNGFTAAVGRDELANDPRLAGLRKEMLGTALKFYTGLQESLESEPTREARDQLSAAYARVASVHEVMGERPEALTAYRRALAIREDLVAAAPADHRQRSGLAYLHLRIGAVLRWSGRPEEALGSLERAVTVAQTVVRDHPEVAGYKDQLAWCLQNLGVVQVWVGRPDEAVRSQQQALAVRESLAREDPASLQLRADLAWCHHDLGSALDAAGFKAEALRHLGRAVEGHEEVIRDHTGFPVHRYRLAVCLASLASVRRGAGDPGWRQLIERSLAIHEALVRERPNEFLYLSALVDRASLLAIEQAAGGRLDEALASIRKAEQALERFPNAPPVALYNLACAYARCSAAARPGVEGPSPAECEGYADRAMAVLRRAITAGFTDVAFIRRDMDLDALRPRRDFQELLMDLSFPSDPFRH
jgi:serine/threonine-protein kinase